MTDHSAPDMLDQVLAKLSLLADDCDARGIGDEASIVSWFAAALDDYVTSTAGDCRAARKQVATAMNKEGPMAWDKTETTAEYLASLMVCHDGDFFLRSSIGGYTCGCGRKLNIWNGPPSLCECGACITTSQHQGPEMHADPDVGPTCATVARAVEIACLQRGTKTT